MVVQYQTVMHQYNTYPSTKLGIIDKIADITYIRKYRYRPQSSDNLNYLSLGFPTNLLIYFILTDLGI